MKPVKTNPVRRENATHFVHCNGAAVFVKEAAFFRMQGGDTEEWGRNWEPVIAGSIEDARSQGASLFGVSKSYI